jgi:predicted DNA-binding transcriptional regulator AlpA
MDYEAFNNLELIPKLLEHLNTLNIKILNIENELIKKFDLTKRDGVKKFLDISDSTLYQMMNDGRLKQGVHYKKTLKGKRVNIIFVESAIVDFKENQK